MLTFHNLYFIFFISLFWVGTHIFFPSNWQIYNSINVFFFSQFFRKGYGDFFIGVFYQIELAIPFIVFRGALASVRLIWINISLYHRIVYIHVIIWQLDIKQSSLTLTFSVQLILVIELYILFVKFFMYTTCYNLCISFSQITVHLYVKYLLS